MLKSSTASEESRPFWGRGLLSPIYSFFHPVSRQEIQRVIDASRAERAKADTTMARSDESNKKTERVIADARAFLSQVEDYKQRLEQGEDVSPPVPGASL